MEQPNQFRSSFNGFNREDVVRYMEFINNKHSAQVAQLTNELEYLRGKQDNQDSGRVAQLEKDLAVAQVENENLKQRIAQLEKDLAEKSAAPAPNPAATDSELEAYRRAERVERTAKERARQLTMQTAGVLSNASVQLEDSTAALDALAEQLTEQLEQLRTAMDNSRRTVREAADAVQVPADGQGKETE